ncbi:hypothetical protein Emag_006650 [Eimeria magna]
MPRTAIERASLSIHSSSLPLITIPLNPAAVFLGFLEEAKGGEAAALAAAAPAVAGAAAIYSGAAADARLRRDRGALPFFESSFRLKQEAAAASPSCCYCIFRLPSSTILS